jgi:hypothetical protein
VTGLGASFIKIWSWGTTPQSGSRNSWTRIRNVSGANRPSVFWNLMFSCRDRWPQTKPGYITITRRQSNNHWGGGIAAHLAPNKKIPSAKIHWENSRLDLLWSKQHLPYWLSSKGPNYQRGVLLISADAIERQFEGKRWYFSWTTMSRLTGYLKLRRNWPTWASIILITHPILRIWPRRTTTCYLEWKNNW